MTPPHKYIYVKQGNGSLRIDVELTGGCKEGTRTLEGVAFVFQPESDNPMLHIPRALGIEGVNEITRQIAAKEWESSEAVPS